MALDRGNWTAQITKRKSDAYPNIQHVSISMERLFANICDDGGLLANFRSAYRRPRTPFVGGPGR